MNKDELIELLAVAIAEQTEIDNACDGESIVLNGELPCINLADLAEKILERISGGNDQTP